MIEPHVPPPEDGVVVAMTCPLGVTARKVPAGVPRPEMNRFVVDAVVEYRLVAVRAVDDE